MALANRLSGLSLAMEAFCPPGREGRVGKGQGLQRGNQAARWRRQQRALAAPRVAVPVYTPKDYPLIRELPGTDDMPATWKEWAVLFEATQKSECTYVRMFSTTSASDLTCSKHGWTPIRFQHRSVRDNSTHRNCMMREKLNEERWNRRGLPEKHLREWQRIDRHPQPHQTTRPGWTKWLTSCVP